MGDDNIQKSLFIKNGIMLTLFSLLIRSISMGFRIWLAGGLGEKGLGLYQLILSVYAFFALMATSGLNITCTRLTGEQLARGNTGKALYICERLLCFAVMLGCVLGMILFFSADLIGNSILKNKDASAALRILSFSLPFMAFSSVVRGYFSAKRKQLLNGAEQLIEQLAECAVCYLVFSLDTTCCAPVTGTTAAEVISFIYSLIILLYDRAHCTKPVTREKGLIRSALPIAVPCTANSALRTALSAIENILIPAGLMKYGADSGEALAEYGLISGMAMPLIVFPSVFILPFASLIIPEMSQAAVQGRKNGIRHMSDRMLTAALQFSIPVMILLMFYSKPLALAVYGSEKGGFYLAALAPVVPLMYLDSVIDGMLKGLNEQTSYFITNTIDSVIRAALTYTLLPVFGAKAIIAIIIFSELLNTLLSLFRLIKVTGVKLNIPYAVILPFLSVLIPCLILKLLPFSDKGLAPLVISGTISLISMYNVQCAMYN